MYLGSKKIGSSSQLGVKAGFARQNMGVKVLPYNEKINQSFHGPDLYNGIVNHHNSNSAGNQPMTRPYQVHTQPTRNPGIEKNHKTRTNTSTKWG
jgi:hypothetical protein